MDQCGQCRTKERMEMGESEPFHKGTDWYGTVLC